MAGPLNVAGPLDRPDCTFCMCRCTVCLRVKRRVPLSFVSN